MIIKEKIGIRLPLTLKSTVEIFDPIGDAQPRGEEKKVQQYNFAKFHKNIIKHILILA